jgi:hypothetical protein
MYSVKNLERLLFMSTSRTLLVLLLFTALFQSLQLSAMRRSWEDAYYEDLYYEEEQEAKKRKINGHSYLMPIIDQGDHGMLSEILRYIFGFLNIKDLLTVNKTCKKLNGVLVSNICDQSHNYTVNGLFLAEVRTLMSHENQLIFQTKCYCMARWSLHDTDPKYRNIGLKILAKLVETGYINKTLYIMPLLEQINKALTEVYGSMMLVNSFETQPCLESLFIEFYVKIMTEEKYISLLPTVREKLKNLLSREDKHVVIKLAQELQEKGKMKRFELVEPNLALSLALLADMHE